MLALILACLISQAPPAPATPAPPPAPTTGADKDHIAKIEAGRADVVDKWFAIEYLGHFDDKRSFIYNRARLLAPTVHGEVLNFGIDAGGLKGSPIGVQGNDSKFQRKIEADVLSGPKKFEAVVPEASVHPMHTGPCPGPGPCPLNPKPDSKPLIPIPDPFIQPRRDPMDHLIPVLIAVAVTTIVVGGTLITLGAIAYLLTHRRPPTP